MPFSIHPFRRFPVQCVVSTPRSARIVRWGIGATRPRNTHGHTGQFVSVIELAWWPNSWRQIIMRSEQGRLDKNLWMQNLRT
jgi:hypothetical protein